MQYAPPVASEMIVMSFGQAHALFVHVPLVQSVAQVTALSHRASAARLASAVGVALVAVRDLVVAKRADLVRALRAGQAVLVDIASLAERASRAAVAGAAAIDVALEAVLHLAVAERSRRFVRAVRGAVVAHAGFEVPEAAAVGVTKGRRVQVRAAARDEEREHRKDGEDEGRR